jgi:hypothetical protein
MLLGTDIPYASHVELMGLCREPVGAFAHAASP